MKTAIDLIAEERQKQISKWGFDVEHDLDRNDSGELAMAARAIIIKEQQYAIIEEFSIFGDWMEKYEYIIQLGKDLPNIDPKYKTDDNLIRGCQSKVWLHAEQKEDGKLYLTADSDAVITKGLVGLVITVLSGQPAKDIAESDLYFVDAIGLASHLSPTRSNGLLSMIKQIKLYALGYQMKSMQN